MPDEQPPMTLASGHAVTVERTEIVGGAKIGSLKIGGATLTSKIDAGEIVWPHQATTDLDFGEALKALRAGKCVARAGWNGKGMFLFLVPGSTFLVNRAPLLGIYPPDTPINYHAHIDMKTADGFVVPWLCSQTDALALDWCIVPGPAQAPADDDRRHPV